MSLDVAAAEGLRCKLGAHANQRPGTRCRRSWSMCIINETRSSRRWADQATAQKLTFGSVDILLTGHHHGPNSFFHHSIERLVSIVNITSALMLRMNCEECLNLVAIYKTLTFESSILGCPLLLRPLCVHPKGRWKHLVVRQFKFLR